MAYTSPDLVSDWMISFLDLLLRNLGAEQPKPEPHAIEARCFTEARLLQREVDVLIGGIDKYGTFYGTILHPKGNISVEILKNGLGRVVDYSIDHTSRDNALQVSRVGGV